MGIEEGMRMVLVADGRGPGRHASVNVRACPASAATSSRRGQAGEQIPDRPEDVLAVLLRVMDQVADTDDDPALDRAGVREEGKVGLPESNERVG